MAAAKLPRGTKVDGVFFTEAAELEGMQVIGPIEWSAAGQNQDLRYVKAGLAAAAIEIGANAVVNTNTGSEDEVGMSLSVVLTVRNGTDQVSR